MAEHPEVYQGTALRNAVVDLGHWLTVWEGQDKTPLEQEKQRMILSITAQALWVLSLAGVRNSEVPKTAMTPVLETVRAVALGKMEPGKGLKKLKGFTDG